MTKTEKKKIILMALVYLAYMSLGLPDSLAGTAWPAMREKLGLELEVLGTINTLLLLLSAASSIMSGRIIKKISTEALAAVSAVMTGIALVGYAFAPSFFWIIIFTVPLGLGQGAVDASLNLYVAQNYSARHMNWMNCFWGVGASLAPFVMARALILSNYNAGYFIVGLMELAIAAIIFISIAVGLWKKDNSESVIKNNTKKFNDIETGLDEKLPQFSSILMFFLCVGVEFLIGLWLNSILIESKDIAENAASLSNTVYYGAIMSGRFICGIIVNRVGKVKMVRIGLILGVIGTAAAGLTNNYVFIMIGTALMGLGIGPVFPCLMHQTPVRFKREVSSKIVGYQSGAGFLGGAVLPMITGLLITKISMGLFFVIVIVMLASVFLLNELLERMAYKKIHNNLL